MSLNQEPYNVHTRLDNLLVFEACQDVMITKFLREADNGYRNGSSACGFQHIIAIASKIHLLHGADRDIAKCYKELEDMQAWQQYEAKSKKLYCEMRFIFEIIDAIEKLVPNIYKELSKGKSFVPAISVSIHLEYETPNEWVVIILKDINGKPWDNLPADKCGYYSLMRDSVKTVDGQFTYIYIPNEGSLVKLRYPATGWKND